MKNMGDTGLKNAVLLFFILIAFIGYLVTLEPSIEKRINIQIVELFQKNNFSIYAVSKMTPIVSADNTRETSLLTKSNYVVGQKLNVSNAEYILSDPRIVAMRQYLIDNNSPMYLYSAVFIQKADEYNLDWRLVASIAGVESAFGKMTPYDSNNAWGWRGGPGGAFSKFDDWGDGISTVTQGLATGYGINLTPFQIESAYCPTCSQNLHHPWANGVQNNMNTLDFYLSELEN